MDSRLRGKTEGRKGRGTLDSGFRRNDEKGDRNDEGEAGVARGREG